MAHNKLYRNFIILQEDERGYSTSKDKALSGYAKVEAKGDKCKVSFYAQNLKPEDNYSMVLICCKRDTKQLIDLGPLAINEVGKGDTSKEYYINNIAGLGISYEKISGAAICRIKGGETGFIMYGFMNGEESTENWRKFKLVKVDDKRFDSKLDLASKKIEIAKVDTKIINKATVQETAKATLESAKVGAKVEIKVAPKIEEESRRKTTILDNIKTQPPEEGIKDNVNIEPEVLNRQDDKVDVEVDDRQLNVIEEESNKVEEVVEVLSEQDRNKNKKCDKENKKEKDKKCDKDDNKYKDEKHDKDKKCDKYDDKYEYKECDKDDGKYKDEKHDKDQNNYKDKKYDKYDKGDKYKDKKCDKYDNKDEYKEYDKEQEWYKEDKKNNVEYSIEEYIKMLAEKLEDYEGAIDFNMNLDGDFIVYGIIKDKAISGCKWKKFKIDKYCCAKSNNSIERQDNSRRIEENTITDSLNFEQYEEDIQRMKKSNDFSIKGKEGKYFEKLAEDFEPYNEKLNDINYCKWYKVDVNSIEDLCNQSNYNKYTLAYYPMLNYYPYINKSNYFLLGYKCNRSGELQYIVYGIPGSKDKNEQPFGGKTGFVTWTNDDTRDQGYWLMFYDYKNSSIVVPMK